MDNYSDKLSLAVHDISHSKDYSLFQMHSDSYRNELTFAQTAVRTFGTKALDDLAPPSQYGMPRYKELVQQAVTAELASGQDANNGIAIRRIDESFRSELGLKFGQSMKTSELHHLVTSHIRAEELSRKLALQRQPSSHKQAHAVKI